VRTAGTISLGISLLIWFITTFPIKKDFTQNYPAMIRSAETAQSAGQITAADANRQAARYKSAMAAERIEYSFAGRLGKFIEPVIKPLGFDWRLGIALVSGFAAKEVVVSTMGTIYGVADPNEESESLRDKLATDPHYSHLIAYAFLVFVLLYMPCMASLAVFLRESGSTRELLFQIGMTLAMAWIMALIVYQGGKLLGLG